jgi:hypothetical protein
MGFEWALILILLFSYIYIYIYIYIYDIIVNFLLAIYKKLAFINSMYDTLLDLTNLIIASESMKNPKKYELMFWN